MDGEELISLLENDENICKGSYGIYSADKIPTIDVYPTAFIANTDESHLPGQHWVAFYFKSKNQIPEYFDSYGLSPIKYSFLQILPKKYKYSTHTIQDLSSITCGEYCIYFLKKRASNVSMQKIISSFSSDTQWNERKIKYYIQNQKNVAVNSKDDEYNPQCCISQQDFNHYNKVK